MPPTSEQRVGGDAGAGREHRDTSFDQNRLTRVHAALNATAPAGSVT
jgi:hypothetical protein